ncbi:MAG TPA: CoA transferase, partial [Rhodocyclaceae bacterium]|nr:CoA transferase [Rhodocyclaceae bacterium]
MFPLKGVRVLDLSKILAGPLCTQYLGELGAEVIKIEPPEGGDDTRSWPPRKDGQGAVFLAVNRNKQSVAVDLKSPEGVEIVKKIAKSAQVVVESYGTGVAERLGIDYRSLREVNPSLVYCAISGYGRTGPMGQQPGYDLMGQAFSGIMSLTGEKDGGPIRSPFSPLDQTTGMHALVGVLAGLMNRQQTGEGKYMEVSLFETALAFLAYNAQSYWVKGVVPERFGSGHESLCPYQAFEAADGYVLLGVGNDNLWRKFCAVAGLQAIQDDPKFKTNPDRVAHFDETVRIVAEVMKRQPVDAWVEILQRAGVPCAPIN